MPNRKTFEIPPIRAFVEKYLKDAEVSVDPFANNSNLATYTNDLNENTSAQYHMFAEQFLELLLDRGITADVILFDPPYSLRQAKEVYEGFGRKRFTQKDAQNVGHWSAEKSLCAKLLRPDGYFLQFGWNTYGLGKKRSAVIQEILLVAHGAGHHDTLCTAEQLLW